MNTMRGLFFIVKGQYRKGMTPSVTNTASGSENFLGGYDPEDPNTEEWYMLLDRTTYRCASCGGNIDNILKVLARIVKRHKGNADTYTKAVSNIMPKVSEPMRCLYENIDHLYGDYFDAEISEVVDQVYEEIEEKLREERPINKSRKLLSKVKHKPQVVVETPKKVLETTPKVVKPKVKIGVKKLAMS